MTIGSWLYNDKRITYKILTNETTGKDNGFVIQNPDNWYTDNIEWDFSDNKIEDVVLVQSQGTFRYKRFIVKIKREGGTMLVGMIVPGVLVAFLGSLYYLLPRGSGERISFLNTIILTEIMFLVMVTQVVPQTKNIPSIAILFLEETMMLSFLMIFVLLMDKVQKVHDQTIAKFQARGQTLDG
jgi:Neurotransmitter-gated ion-channel transmembrane region